MLWILMAITACNPCAMNGRQSTLWAWGWTPVPYQGVQMSSIQGTLQRAGCVNLDPAWRTPTRWMPYVLQGVIVNLGDLNASSVLVHNHPQSWLADGSHLPNTSSSLAINPCQTECLVEGLFSAISQNNNDSSSRPICWERLSVLIISTLPITKHPKLTGA